MRKSWLKTLPAILAASLLLVTGASATDAPSNATGARNLNRQVYHELVMLPQLTVFDDLSFTVNDGTVTLTGEVRNAVLKDEAANVVKRIAGVEQVNNQIQILHASFNDDRIRREVARSIFRDDQLFRYSLEVVPSIHIIVMNGDVSLRGVVDNQADKNVAGIRANGVPGVFSVNNSLLVQAK
ncbi:MAG TPA: BON domain-containing protein [Candidatus Angelobacter sp.]|nr:BON domain-containing protein [Candidatus Angelobacter sp.]